MKLTEKLEYLQKNHFGEWLNTRRRIEQDMSDRNGMWCVCGRLATGLHESSCRKLANAITKRAVQEMAHLLPIKVKEPIHGRS